MAQSFFEGLFKGLEKGTERAYPQRQQSLDPLELMLKHAQIERQKKEDEIQAENLAELIRKRQRGSEIIPEEDSFVARFPELKGRTREEASGLLPSLLSSESKREQREKLRPLTSFESQQILSLSGSGRRLNKINTQFEGIKKELGPLNPKAYSQKLIQLANDPKFATFKKDVLQEFNEYRKRITGAQAVFKEIEFLQEASLTEKDPPEVFMAKLNDFIDEAEFNRKLTVNMLELQNKPVPENLIRPFTFKSSGINELLPGQDQKKKRLEELRAKKLGK